MCYAKAESKLAYVTEKEISVGISLLEWRDRANFFDFEGNRIAYWTHGAGKPLLLIHGFPTASWDWAPTWNLLDHRQHTLIAADMLGFGLSDKPRDGYTINRQTDLQLALLDHLGIGAFDVLAHNYGVSVGQELLARQAEGALTRKLGRVIFLNGGIFPRQHRAVMIQKLGLSPLGPLVSRLLNRDRFARSFSQIFGPQTKPTASEIDDFWELICEQDGNRITHKLLHYIWDRRVHEERWVGALQEAQGRVGLINGAADPVSGEHVFNRWVEYLPEAKAYLLPDIGHYPQVEAPRIVAEIALEWLA